MDWLMQAWQEIAARPDGPMAARFYLQPFTAVLFAIRDGLKDARFGRAAYGWAVCSNPEHRSELLKDGWKSIGKVFLFAMGLDLVYQWIVLHAFRPLETVLVATTLAIIPYLAVRGPINRIARFWTRPSSTIDS